MVAKQQMVGYGAVLRLLLWSITSPVTVNALDT